ncbi:hypothetical protein QFZ47_003363 [Variovorax paradoxus]|nr:hypothetical protein [Variovorax paradoxus]
MALSQPCCVKGWPRAQRPSGADRIALGLGRRVVGNCAAVADLHVAHAGELARRHRDDDLARRLGAGRRLVELQRQRGREVAQRAEQFARIAFGRHHEPRNLGGAQVVERAVALDVQVQREVFAHRVGPADVDGEGIAPRCALVAVLPALVGRRITAAYQRRGGRVRGGFLFRQQAASLQKQDAAKKQGRPPCRRND